MGHTELLEEVLLDQALADRHQLVLFNDDINTFDYVIETLVDVCEHSTQQAEQCSIIVHYKGKCTVKTGALKDLNRRCSLLLEAGLSAEVIS